MILQNYKMLSHNGETESMDDFGKTSKSRPSHLLKIVKLTLLSLPIVILAAFGILHIVLIAMSHTNFFGNQHLAKRFRPDRSEPISTYDGDTSQVLPIPCHSHNDYWRPLPLFDALHAGCTSVEADIWLTGTSNELRVGHKKGSLSASRTLESLYLDPIIRLLDQRNQNLPPSTPKTGLFSLSPTQTLVLLLDLKTDASTLLPRIQKALDPLRKRSHLTSWNGQNLTTRPVTIVLTGDALSLNELTHRDIFFDAPLATLQEQDERWNISNAYYASTSFKASIGTLWNGRLSSHQLNKLRAQIRAAKSQGLRARYWDTPAWPTSLRNYVWEVLLQEGAEVLNVDDLRAAAFLDWRDVKHSWFDG